MIKFNDKITPWKKNLNLTIKYLIQINKFNQTINKFILKC